MNVILLLQTVVIAMVSSDVHGHVFAYMLFWHANKKQSFSCFILEFLQSIQSIWLAIVSYQLVI